MNKKHWNLLVPTQLASLPLPQQYATYALAYLDSAQRLCGVLARSHRKATFERGAVVHYLAAHSIELFLKGAILRRAAAEKLTHDLDHLHKRYKKLYPEKRYKLENPFQTNYPDGMSSADKRMLKALTPPTDQLFRYPNDRDGNPWIGAHGIQANLFQQQLTTLRQEFEHLLIAYDS